MTSPALSNELILLSKYMGEYFSNESLIPRMVKKGPHCEKNTY